VTTANLPNLVIAGVGKAGTTSLFWYLAQHSDVCRSDVKEIDFFAPLRYPGGELPPLEEYAAHFRHWDGERYRLEASPGYLYGGSHVRSALAQTLQDPRLIMILRDPAERVYPSYRYLQSRLQLPEEMTFNEYVERCVQLRGLAQDGWKENRLYWTISAGFYESHLAAWLDMFGDTLKVLFYEHLAADPRRMVVELCEWLDIDPVQAKSFNYEVQNRTVTPRSRALQSVALKVNRTPLFTHQRRLKAPIRRLYHALNGKPRRDAADPQTQAFLHELYAPANRALADMLRERGSTDLPAWLAGTAGTTATAVLSGPVDG
jgi:hypothetical protein